MSGSEYKKCHLWLVIRKPRAKFDNCTAIVSSILNLKTFLYRFNTSNALGSWQTIRESQRRSPIAQLYSRPSSDNRIKYKNLLWWRQSIPQVRDAALSLSRKTLVSFHQGDHPISRFERQWTIPDTYEQLIGLLSQYAVYLISFSFPRYFLYFNTFNTGIGFLHAIHPLTNPAVLNQDQFFFQLKHFVSNASF